MTKGCINSPEWKDNFACDIFSRQIFHLESLSTKSKNFCGMVTLFAIAMSILYYLGLSKSDQYLWFVPISVIGNIFVSCHWASVDLFNYQITLIHMASKYTDYTAALPWNSSSPTELCRLSRMHTLTWYTLMLSIQLFASLVAIGLALTFSWQAWLLSSISLSTLLASGVFWAHWKFRHLLSILQKAAWD